VSIPDENMVAMAVAATAERLHCDVTDLCAHVDDEGRIVVERKIGCERHRDVIICRGFRFR
jgi:hypothetical protein